MKKQTKINLIFGSIVIAFFLFAALVPSVSSAIKKANDKRIKSLSQVAVRDTIIIYRTDTIVVEVAKKIEPIFIQLEDFRASGIYKDDSDTWNYKTLTEGGYSTTEKDAKKFLNDYSNGWVTIVHIFSDKVKNKDFSFYSCDYQNDERLTKYIKEMEKLLLKN